VSAHATEFIVRDIANEKGKNGTWIALFENIPVYFLMKTQIYGLC